MGSIIAFAALFILAILIVNLIKGNGRNKVNNNVRNDYIRDNNTSANDILLQNSILYGGSVIDPNGQGDNGPDDVTDSGCDCGDAGCDTDCDCDSGCDSSCDCDCGGND